ncbi:LexA family protein [Janthinobacterium sp. GB4P2]|uniref:LexA family protein n=1 Tax=Janthinobacterium sp. GB4P2 TaxID=3424189 RepID=UPI003F27134D
MNALGQTIKSRLSALRKTQGWLAERANVSHNAVSKWIKTGKISRENAVLVAQALSCSVDELLLGEGDDLIPTVNAAGQSRSLPAHEKGFDQNAKPVPLGTRAIPVISAIQAGAMKEITMPYSPGDGYTTIYVDDSYSQWAFGLEIEGDSMMPDYKPGDVVIIEPEWEPRPGDCVAAKNGKQEATFKKYRLRGSNPDGNDIFELLPINDNYPTVRSDETPLTIIGVMAELRRKTRRR